MKSYVEREELTLSFDGPALQNHEMDVATLASSLVSFKELTEHVSRQVNGRKFEVAVKVKGGFRQGSFIVTLLVDSMGAILPQAPGILSSVVNLINIFKFLRGQPYKVITKTPSHTAIRNCMGHEAYFNNSTVIMADRVEIKKIVANFARPINGGINKIALTPTDLEIEGTRIAAEDRESFLLPEDDAVEVEETTCDLEVLSPNLDGKSSNWRFYAPEDDVEFSATMIDEEFLSDVRDSKYSFQRGVMLNVALTTTKKKVNQRKRTERTITSVLDYTRP